MSGEQIMPLTLLPTPLDSKSYLHLWYYISEKIFLRLNYLGFTRCYWKKSGFSIRFKHRYTKWFQRGFQKLIFVVLTTVFSLNLNNIDNFQYKNWSFRSTFFHSTFYVDFIKPLKISQIHSIITTVCPTIVTLAC